MVIIKLSNPYLVGSDFPSGVLFPIAFHSMSIAAMSFLTNLFLMDLIGKVASFRIDLNC
jgi:hypothetical protein